MKMPESIVCELTLWNRETNTTRLTRGALWRGTARGVCYYGRRVFVLQFTSGSLPEKRWDFSAVFPRVMFVQSPCLV